MKNKLIVGSILLCSAISFALLTVFAQVKELGLSYLETSQLSRHMNVLLGKAGDAWQYRIFSEYLVEGIIVALRNLGFQHPITTAFISLRIFQNTIIFVLASLYYKKLGLNTYVTLIGLSLLAWGMTHAFYDSDLQFNTYFDIIFYLTAALLILHNRHAWIIPVAGLAALNRETSGLIPFLLISYSLYTKAEKGQRSIAMIIAAIACGLYTIIFFGLRLTLGPQPLIEPYGHTLGFNLFMYNISRYRTYVQLFATLSILPFTAIFSFARWPRSLKAFFWTIVPIWLPVHTFLAVTAETRMFLVPLALIFVPGTLFGIVNPDNQSLLLSDRNPVKPIPTAAA